MLRKKGGKFAVTALLLLGLAVAAAGIWKYSTKKPEYIFLMGEVRSFEDYPMFKNFENEITNLGCVPRVLEIEESENSSIRQIQKLSETVNDNTVCIIVNAASNENLAGILQKYQERGIKILSCISEVSALYRLLHVGTVDPRTAGPEMMTETARLCGEKGQFAIVSGAPHSVSATTLMMEVRYRYEQRRHPGMILSDILFGYENVETASEKIKQFLEETPDTSALICLSERMTEAACMAVQALEAEDHVTIIGMGDPDYLEDYVKDEKLKMELFYCNMADFGTMVAQLSQKVVSGEVKGTPGEIVKLDQGNYLIKEDEILTEDDIPGSEVYLYQEYKRYQTSSLTD
ncbi:MAG: substrate-binding domain-containing protein [Eubacteriales bacterium]|nr:substrate-binding domain-containing protein [Eubacteriales bacterium]